MATEHFEVVAVEEPILGRELGRVRHGVKRGYQTPVAAQPIRILPGEETPASPKSVFHRGPNPSPETLDRTSRVPYRCGLWISLSRGLALRKQRNINNRKGLSLKTRWHFYPAQPVILKTVKKAELDRLEAGRLLLFSSPQVLCFQYFSDKSNGMNILACTHPLNDSFH